MILTDIKEQIDKRYKQSNLMDAYVFTQGYIQFAKDFAVINLGDYRALKKYNQQMFKDKLDSVLDTKKIMEKIKGGNNG